jgi:hypothetical protein
VIDQQIARKHDEPEVKDFETKDAPTDEGGNFGLEEF